MATLTNITYSPTEQSPVLQIIHNLHVLAEWVILDGPHLQPAWPGASHGHMFVYARHPETGKQQRIYLSDDEAQRVKDVTPTNG